MPNVVIVGAQWGDEGKGKVVDLYTEFADVVIRYQGGANAGHTLVVPRPPALRTSPSEPKDLKLVLHLIPSGALHAGKVCVLGGGMVIDPAVLLEEIDELKKLGFLARDQDLWVSSQAHVVMPYHRALDVVREEEAARASGAGNGAAIGTTRRGIGPAYEDKLGRRGIRMADLLVPDRLRGLVACAAAEANATLVRLGGQPVDVDEVTARAIGWGERLRRYVTDTSARVHAEMKRGKSLLFEGAQGTLLDVDHGTYPYVTSSSTTAGGACTGVGVGPTALDAVIGISKAYSTRVGGGPFPTELHGELGEHLRTVGVEFGATTGRPRRCGWLDAVALRYAVRVNGLCGLALTKLDVLRGIHPLRIATAYRLRGQTVTDFPLDAADLAEAEPLYEELDGWDEDTREARTVEDLPEGAARYVRRIESLVEAELYLVSVGPGRGETVVLKNPFR
jgi:adenylosuccinate synthase